MKPIHYLAAAIVLLPAASACLADEVKPLPHGSAIEAKNLPSNLWGTWRVSDCKTMENALIVKGMSIRVGSSVWHVTGVQPLLDKQVTATVATGDQASFKTGKVMFQLGRGTLVVDGIVQSTFRRSCP